MSNSLTDIAPQDAMTSTAGRRTSMLLLTVGLAMMLLLAMTQALQAEVLAADLTNSYKMVDKSTAAAGETLEYTIVISNSATGPADGTVAYFTDTLPAHVSYVDGTLSASHGTATETNGVVIWHSGNAGLAREEQATVSFMVAISDAVSVDDVVQNNVIIAGDNVSATAPFTRSAMTTIISETTSTDTVIYLPFAMRKVLEANIQSLSRPDGNNDWTLTWDDAHDRLGGSGIVGYEIQESHDPEFADGVTIYNVATVDSYDFDKSESPNNIYYYRVRSRTADGDVSIWSNVVRQIGVYYDDFSDPSTGWIIVRDDNDQDSVEYVDGVLNLELSGRWDYQIASALVEVPEPPYRIETRIRLDGVDNLHALGLVFGADYNSNNPCPTECFNSYYRVLGTWFSDDAGILRTRLKYIYLHDEKNEGRGDDVGNLTDANVGNPSSGWKTWVIEHHADGRIVIHIEGRLIYDVVPQHFLTGRYFGLTAATDEYAGLDAQADYVRVSPMD